MSISPLLTLYLAMSLLTLALYAWDKSAARAGRRRIRERTLHLFALAGGWPGALLGRRWFRHKTRKQPFRTLFWLSVVANMAVVGYLLWYGKVPALT